MRYASNISISLKYFPVEYFIETTKYWRQSKQSTLSLKIIFVAKQFTLEFHFQKGGIKDLRKIIIRDKRLGRLF